MAAAFALTTRSPIDLMRRLLESIWVIAVLPVATLIMAATRVAILSETDLTATVTHTDVAVVTTATGNGILMAAITGTGETAEALPLPEVAATPPSTVDEGVIPEVLLVAAALPAADATTTIRLQSMVEATAVVGEGTCLRRHLGSFSDN